MAAVETPTGMGEEQESHRTTPPSLPALSASVEPGRTPSVVQRFRILETQGIIVGKTLGMGSYASVRLGYDARAKRRVAVKVISKRRAPADYLAKFLPREIAVVRAMRCPALITFYQVIETTTRYFLIMEYAENGDLLEMIRAKKFIGEQQASRWFMDLYVGISYMHSMGVAHRDLKCENLLIDHRGNLRVTDFGFSRYFDPAHDNLSTTFCGSYAYAPPEILKGQQYNPFVSEIWSMGVVLYTMVFGRLPFDDSDHKRLLKLVLQGVKFPSMPFVTEDLKHFLLRLLARRSERLPLSDFHSERWFQRIEPCSSPSPPSHHSPVPSPRGTKTARSSATD